MSLLINFPLFSQGDICDDAQEITINDTYTADGPSSGGGCFTCPDAAMHADWYKFTPATNTNISVSSCIDGIDTHFYVYEGSCGALTEVAANDDAGCGVGTNFASNAEFAVTGGTEYYIEWVDHWATDSFNFVIEEIACPSPTQLNFANLTDQSVDVQWTTSNTGISFALEYGEFGFSPGSGTTITGDLGVDGPPVSIMGLNPSTVYEVYITENCMSGDIFLGPIDFTTFADIAANDICSSAIELACGDNVSSSTINATIDTDALDCGDIDIDANGIWYHFTGVDGLITISTCGTINFDTRLSVYGGSCDALECIASNDDDLDCEEFAATAHFPAEVGNDYFILVHGTSTDAGDFILNLECGPVCSPVPSNGECTSAETITPTSGCSTIASTNSCASINLFSPECSPFQETQDVWYTFNSGDNTALGLEIDLLDAEEMGFSIFENCGDNSLICITGSEDLEVFSVMENTDYLIQFWSQYDDSGAFEFCLRDDVCSGATDVSLTDVDETTAEITWTTSNPGMGFVVEYGEFGFSQGDGSSVSGVLGTDGPPVTITSLDPGLLYEYYVSEDCEIGEVIAGPFTFITDGSAPGNDNCADAQSIDPCGESVMGTTINAAIESVDVCAGVPSTSPGVWYVMTIQDNFMYSLSTCNDANFDTKISLYTGDCNDLTCFNANDDAAGCNNGSSEILFDGFAGNLYVLVHGFGSEQGNFTLTSSCVSGIDEVVTETDIDIYPNPTNGMLNIRFSDITETSSVNIEVFSVSGQKVFELNNQNISQGEIRNLDLSQLNSGLYSVLLTNGNLISRKNLVIE